MRAAALAVLISFVLLGAVRPLQAQSVLEALAGLKFCKTLKEDGQRLKCFDGLISENSEDRGSKNKPEAELEWTIVESKSPLDDSPQVLASLPASNGRAQLTLRCREKHTEALFGSLDFIYFGQERVRVLVRFDDAKLIETRWSPSTNGRAAFAPSAIQFVKALQEDGKLFIRVHDRDGKSADGEFKLKNVASVREKIAEACKWPADKDAKR